MITQNLILIRARKSIILSKELALSEEHKSLNNNIVGMGETNLLDFIREPLIVPKEPKSSHSNSGWEEHNLSKEPSSSEEHKSLNNNIMDMGETNLLDFIREPLIVPGEQKYFRDTNKNMGGADLSQDMGDKDLSQEPMLSEEHNSLSNSRISFDKSPSSSKVSMVFDISDMDLEEGELSMSLEGGELSKELCNEHESLPDTLIEEAGSCNKPHSHSLSYMDLEEGELSKELCDEHEEGELLKELCDEYESLPDTLIEEAGSYNEPHNHSLSYMDLEEGELSMLFKKGDLSKELCDEHEEGEFSKELCDEYESLSDTLIKKELCDEYEEGELSKNICDEHESLLDTLIEEVGSLNEPHSHSLSSMDLEEADLLNSRKTESQHPLKNPEIPKTLSLDSLDILEVPRLSRSYSMEDFYRRTIS
ncbi:hypothetical protein AMTR_s00100p00157090 [Amborella trichopoda]|uniref:Uncharacterized protein n=1 Tax=Amborella trichopoda TaxID=13333 RepID=W1NT54_AMBTC|nr:hypothetical protein AMTR_s00100p00157090 [Amborella trichopoda]